MSIGEEGVLVLGVHPPTSSPIREVVRVVAR